MKKNVTKTWLGRGVIAAAIAAAVAVSVPVSASAAGMRFGNWQATFEAAQADLDRMKGECEADGGEVTDPFVDSGSNYRAQLTCSV